MALMLAAMKWRLRSPARANGVGIGNQKDIVEAEVQCLRVDVKLTMTILQWRYGNDNTAMTIRQ